MCSVAATTLSPHQNSFPSYSILSSLRSLLFLSPKFLSLHRHIHICIHVSQSLTILCTLSLSLSLCTYTYEHWHRFYINILQSAMHGLELWFKGLIELESRELRFCDDFDAIRFVRGGLFLESAAPSSVVSFVAAKSTPTSLSCRRRSRRRLIGGFLSVSLTIKGGGGGGGGGYDRESREVLGQNGERSCEDETTAFEEARKGRGRGRGEGALNTTKHLWAGAIAAMVSRTFVAPLERLKLEYMVRGEQKNLFELVNAIAISQGLKEFWKGNFVNILRTAPFKAINFYAYDTYRNQLLKMSGNEETTNFERFLAGAAAGVTATMLCIPMDTIRTKIVAPGGEALGGVIGAFHHMIQTEGFFSLYKGLVPSIISMAPSGAVFYGVYDILKSAYLHSPEGKKRIQHMKQQVGELNALEQLELGTIRTLIYGAIAGACSEAATYPFEVVRRQLQMQVRETEMSALATCVKLVEQGGVPALYAGVIPSLLQVFPSAAISYFVYEFMKIVLKVEST